MSQVAGQRIPESDLLGEDPGVTIGSTWIGGAVTEPIGLRGENGGRETDGLGCGTVGLLGGRGGGEEGLGVEVFANWVTTGVGAAVLGNLANSSLLLDIGC